MTSKIKSMVGLSAPQKDWTEETLADSAVKPLMTNLSVEPVRLSQLVKVSFDSPDAKLAARVANDISSNYIDSDRDAKFKLAQSLNGWLEKRATTLRENLLESEKALQAYREEKGLINLSGSAQGLAGMQINEANQRLAEARSKRMQLEGTYNMVANAGSSDYSNVPGVANSPASATSHSTRRCGTEAGSRTVREPRGPNHIKMQEAQSSLAAARRYLSEQTACSRPQSGAGVQPWRVRPRSRWRPH